MEIENTTFINDLRCFTLNLIEFNPLSNKNFKAATQESIDKFSKTIQDAGFLSLFRRSRGRDINASCGSLANKKALNN